MFVVLDSVFDCFNFLICLCRELGGNNMKYEGDFIERCCNTIEQFGIPVQDLVEKLEAKMIGVYSGVKVNNVTALHLEAVKEQLASERRQCERRKDPQSGSAMNPFEIVRSKLTPQQLMIVQYSSLRPLAVIAGAGKFNWHGTQMFSLTCRTTGSGKTLTIAARCAHLISSLKMNASNILVLAFTRKAAEEMRSRIARLIGDVAHECTITTFHGLALRIIKRHYARLGFKFAPALATSRAIRQELGICIQSWLQRNPSANCQRWTNDEYGETLDDLENDNDTEHQGFGGYSHSQPSRSSQAASAANLELETVGPAITHFRSYFKKARASGVSPEQFSNEYLYVWKMYVRARTVLQRVVTPPAGTRPPNCTWLALNMPNI